MNLLESRLRSYADLISGFECIKNKDIDNNVAVPLYEAYCEQVSVATGKETGRGVFGADMKVELINDGPVTIIIDSKLKE